MQYEEDSFYDQDYKKTIKFIIEELEYAFTIKENLKTRDEFKTIIDTTYLRSTWTAKRAQSLGNKEMFNLGGRSYTQNEFAKFLETQMTIRTQDDAWEVVKPMYNKWVEECVVAFEDSQLEKNYVEFRNLVREYREGILLFDLTDQKVWSKAVKDTSGLKKYYEDHKTSYQWDERADVTNYKCVNEVVAKDVRKMLAAKKTDKEILEAANKTSQLNLSIENIFYLKNEKPIINENWKAGIVAKDYVDPNEKKVVVIVVNKILPMAPKTLPECRGMVTADFQNHLESEWLSYLKNKYKVTINEDVLKTVK